MLLTINSISFVSFDDVEYVNLITNEVFDGFAIVDENRTLVKMSKLSLSKRLLYNKFSELLDGFMELCDKKEVDTSNLPNSLIRQILKGAKLDVTRALIKNGETYVNAFGLQKVADFDMIQNDVVGIIVSKEVEDKLKKFVEDWLS